MPHGVSNIGGHISANADQDARVTIDVQIANHDGMNNWGANFDPNDPDDFDWWLDKRLNVYMGLRLDNEDEIEYIRMGHFIVTHFKTNHELVEFPVIEIQGGSKEVLFASRRGKFLYDTTILPNTVMTESIKTILKGGGELDKNIRIDPYIADKSVLLEDGTDITKWQTIIQDTTIKRDMYDFATLDSSLRIDVKSNKIGILAEKSFAVPVDMTSFQSLAFFGKCSSGIS